MGFHPSAEIVAVAWLQSIVDLDASVATTLPERGPSWEDTAFIVVTTVGGGQHPYTYMQIPVVQLDSWAYNVNSQKVPWGRAQQPLERVKHASRTPACKRTVTTPAAYNDAYVHGVHVQSDPFRDQAHDGSDYAHYRCDVQFRFTEIEDV